MIRLLAKGVVLAAAVFLNCLAHAAWVGVFLFRSPMTNDHIHVSVNSAEENFTSATMLNVWNDETFNFPMWGEMKFAEKYIIFWHPKTKQEIVAEWNIFMNKIEGQKSILSKNCAYSTKHLLKEILNINLSRRVNLARLFAFIWLPNILSPIPLPESVYNNLKTTFIKDDKTFYTHHDFNRSNLTHTEFLKSLEK